MASGETSPLVAQLASASDPEERFAALAALSDLAADSYGIDAANLAAVLRSAGCIQLLVEQVMDVSPEVVQCAMSLLGNLLTDVFDPEARLSLDLFAAAGGLPVLQAKLSADFPINLFAVAALQNITALDPEDCCAKLRDQGVGTELTGLANSDNEQVRDTCLAWKKLPDPARASIAADALSLYVVLPSRRFPCMRLEHSRIFVHMIRIRPQILPSKRCCGCVGYGTSSRRCSRAKRPTRCSSMPNAGSTGTVR